MELDHSNRSSEKTAEADNHQVVHVTWSSTTTTSDDQDSSSGHTATTRSYRCSFCQRGFSNAQALGGHMNIHRKDRARLKTTLSLDTTTKNQFSPPHPYTPLLLHAQESSSCSSVDERCSSQKRRPIIETADSDNGELQLSLSIETSSSSNELKEESNTQQVKRSMHQQHQQLKPGAPQKTDLDLELRLGPDRTTN